MLVDKFSDERISCSITRKSVRIMFVVSPSTLLVNLKNSALEHYVVKLTQHHFVEGMICMVNS